VADVLLFHHVQGLTPGVLRFAEQLRAGGRDVHAPDLFDGQTFPTLDDGMAHARAIGFDTIQERGLAEAHNLPAESVYVGLSMGVMPAQQLAQTRNGARGAVLIDACLPVGEFGDGWPTGVPVQVHGMDADPIFAGEGDLEAAQALVGSTEQAELFLYPGTVHLFADSSLPSYDAAAAEQMVERILTFLATMR
jgi:dienelactone hydrolase